MGLNKAIAIAESAYLVPVAPEVKQTRAMESPAQEIVETELVSAAVHSVAL